MLQLTREQCDQVERLLLQRQAAGVSDALAQAWPEVAERMLERWPAFVATLLERAQAHGLSAPLERARYASLCCLWGVAFEGKAGFEWAQEILADTRRGAALKLHQLLHRSRSELAQRNSRGASGELTPAFFDAAMAKVEAIVAVQLGARAVFLDEPAPPPPRACDLTLAELQWVQAVAPTYALRDGLWRLTDPAQPVPQALSWTLAPDEPASFAFTSHAVGAGAPARLNLGLKPLAACDAARHPEVMYRSALGQSSWRGPDTARLSLALHAPAPAATDEVRGPGGIAWTTAPDAQELRIASCGVRDAGAPFGSVALALQVFPATQWLAEVRHGPMPPLSLPAASAAVAASAGVQCRLAADGAARDAGAWDRAWHGLQPQCRAGLEKLFNAWSRHMIGSSARLEGEASAMVGQAGVTWGWQPRPEGRVAMCVAGEMDWTALVLDLHLSGEVNLEGACARVSLRCQGRSVWRMSLRQLEPQATEGEALADAVCTWRHPFALTLDALAGSEPVVLSLAPVPAAQRGAVVGSCGLRPRPDGKGLQWFYTLEVESVVAVFGVSDPLLGEQQSRRELLPALTLIDWSAG